MRLPTKPPPQPVAGELCPLCGDQATYAAWFNGNERVVICTACQTKSFDLFMARINTAVARSKEAA